jgi:hypothetical protein
LLEEVIFFTSQTYQPCELAADSSSRSRAETTASLSVVHHKFGNDLRRVLP